MIPFAPLPFVLFLALKVTIALAVALGVAALARSWSASTRHLVLAAGFGVMLFLTPAALLVPPFAVTLPARAAADPVLRPAFPPPAAMPVTERAAATPAEAAAVEREERVSAALVLMGIYLAVATLLLGSLAIGVLRLRRIRESGEVSVAATRLAIELAREEGIDAPAEVVISEALAVPMTFGVLRPAILLPMSAAEATPEELRDALRHELEHIRRRDWMTQLGARLACALWWPHPLVWIAWRRLCLEAERACDDAVIRVVRNRSDAYAEQLVRMARRITGTGRTPALAMARRSNLGRRIQAILDPGVRRDTASRGSIVATATAGLLLIALLAPVHLVSATAVEVETPLQPVRVPSADQGLREDDADPLDLALYRAAAKGNIGAIEKLLAAGADPNAAIAGDGNPLIGAARGGHLRAVEVLLDRGADIDRGVSGDGNALIVAARAGNERIVATLLDRGADINRGVAGDGNALIAAAAAGKVEIVATLLDRGADIERVVPRDENALIQASARGRAAVVRQLLARGANPNSRVWVERSHAGETGEWRTPLKMAERGGHDEVVRILRAAGAVE